MTEENFDLILEQAAKKTYKKDYYIKNKQKIVNQQKDYQKINNNEVKTYQKSYRAKKKVPGELTYREKQQLEKQKKLAEREIEMAKIVDAQMDYFNQFFDILCVSSDEVPDMLKDIDECVKYMYLSIMNTPAKRVEKSKMKGMIFKRVNDIKEKHIHSQNEKHIIYKFGEGLYVENK